MFCLNVQYELRPVNVPDGLIQKQAAFDPSGTRCRQLASQHTAAYHVTVTTPKKHFARRRAFTFFLPLYWRISTRDVRLFKIINSGNIG